MERESQGPSQPSIRDLFESPSTEKITIYT